MTVRFHIVDNSLVGNTQVVHMGAIYPHWSVTSCLWNASCYYFDEILHANTTFLVTYSYSFFPVMILKHIDVSFSLLYYGRYHYITIFVMMIFFLLERIGIFMLWYYSTNIYLNWSIMIGKILEAVGWICKNYCFIPLISSVSLFICMHKF